MGGRSTTASQGSILRHVARRVVKLCVKGVATVSELLSHVKRIRRQRREFARDQRVLHAAVRGDVTSVAVAIDGSQQTLLAIADAPRQRAADLAESLGFEMMWFKTHVRTLKTLGLTRVSRWAIGCRRGVRKCWRGWPRAPCGDFRSHARQHEFIERRRSRPRSVSSNAGSCVHQG